ncbi:hypothetical protein ACHAQC_009184 [Fusarium culmorum]
MGYGGSSQQQWFQRVTAALQAIVSTKGGVLRDALFIYRMWKALYRRELSRIATACDCNYNNRANYHITGANIHSRFERYNFNYYRGC